MLWPFLLLTFLCFTFDSDKNPEREAFKNQPFSDRGGEWETELFQNKQIPDKTSAQSLEYSCRCILYWNIFFVSDYYTTQDTKCAIQNEKDKIVLQMWNI